MAQSPALIEDGVHEPVGGAVDLSLGERPELDRLDAAGQRVRQAAQGQHARRPGEQVAAGPECHTASGEAIVSGILVVIWSHGSW